MADNDQPQTDKAARKAQAKADRAARKAQEKADRQLEKTFAREEKERERALAHTAEDQLLQDLKASLKTHARSATFACGGRIEFKSDAHQSTVEKAEIDPIDVRFGESGKGWKLTLPVDVLGTKGFEELLSACQPASFGRGGKEVLDEDYRKAGKLDKSEFATTFCPYKTGIIDTIAQLLLPQTAQEKHNRSIKAELYKLNVYSAPSGKFKAHVDTPRDTDQFGSLVVSLPVDHLGGQLAVRNAEKEVVFDWSSSPSDKPGIQWAAFYSDCEHEVYEVTSGHRLTLTYNLHVTRGQGHLAGATTLLNPVQLPLYSTLKSALDTPGFLRRGRVLAIWLTHSYAHTNKHINFLPNSLKGADMSLYETARALNLRCKIVPIISQDYSWFNDHGPAHLASNNFYGFNQGGNGNGNLNEGEGWGSELPNGKITWINPYPSKKQKKTDEDQKPAEDPPKDFKEVQMAYMTYGNEPGIDIHYSRAAMLISVPPKKLRAKVGDKTPRTENFWEGIKGDYDEEGYEDEEYDSEDFEESSEGYEEESGEEWSTDEDEDDDGEQADDKEEEAVKKE